MTRCEPVGAFGEARCVPPHGNSPESMCDACEQRAEDAREARNTQLREALTAFAEQMPGQMWDYAVENTVSAIVRAVNMDGKCRLCGCCNGCAPACAVNALRELL